MVQALIDNGFIISGRVVIEEVDAIYSKKIQNKFVYVEHFEAKRTHGVNRKEYFNVVVHNGTGKERKRIRVDRVSLVEVPVTINVLIETMDFLNRELNG